MVPGTWSLYVCAYKIHFWSILPHLRPDTSAEIHHDCYTAFKLAILRQSFAGNDKHLSETTKLCRTRQGFIGDDKRVSEATKLCRKIYP
jgi:hypothetical protein